MQSPKKLCKLSPKPVSWVLVQFQASFVVGKMKAKDSITKYVGIITSIVVNHTVPLEIIMHLGYTHRTFLTSEDPDIRWKKRFIQSTANKIFRRLYETLFCLHS